MDFKKYIKKCAKTQNVLLIICCAVLVSILVSYTNCAVDRRSYHSAPRQGIPGYDPNYHPGRGGGNNPGYGQGIVKLDRIGEGASNFAEVEGLINGIYLQYRANGLTVYIDDKQDVSMDDDALVFEFNKIGNCAYADSYGQLNIGRNSYSATVTFYYQDDPNTIYDLGSMQPYMMRC